MLGLHRDYLLASRLQQAATTGLEAVHQKRTMLWSLQVRGRVMKLLEALFVPRGKKACVLLRNRRDKALFVLAALDLGG